MAKDKDYNWFMKNHGMPRSQYMEYKRLGLFNHAVLEYMHITAKGNGITNKRELPDKGERNTKAKERIKMSEVNKFPFDIFLEDFPNIRYYRVLNIDFIDRGGKHPNMCVSTIEWFKSLNEDEVNKLNQIMSILEYHLNDIKKKPYLINDVYALGYCIRCRFEDIPLDLNFIYDHDIVYDPLNKKYVDIMEKCFTTKPYPKILTDDSDNVIVYKGKTYDSHCVCQFRRRKSNEYWYDLDPSKFI